MIIKRNKLVTISKKCFGTVNIQQREQRIPKFHKGKMIQQRELSLYKAASSFLACRRKKQNYTTTATKAIKYLEINLTKKMSKVCISKTPERYKS